MCVKSTSTSNTIHGELVIIRDIRGVHIGLAGATTIEIIKPDPASVRMLLHASGRHVGGAANNGYDVLIDQEQPAAVASEKDYLLRRIQLSFPTEAFATIGAQYGGVVAAAQLNQMGFFTSSDRTNRIIWAGFGLYHRCPALAGSELFEYRYIFAEFPADKAEELLK